MAIVHFKLSIDRHDDYVDLCDYGHDSETQWSDLTEDQQDEIKDNIREQHIVKVFPKE
jgi:hypothetical protein